MHATRSYSEFHPVGHGYLICLIRCSCIISPDLGWPSQVQRAEHLPITQLFNLKRVDIFFQNFSRIDSGNNSVTVTVNFDEKYLEKLQ